MSSVRLRVLAGAMILLAGAARAQESGPKGGVKGKITVGVPGVALEAVGPIAVFLEGADGPLKFDPPKGVSTISQKDAQFTPDFLIIAVGQSVSMPNDDRIVHNVFSFSKPNEFDLGLYPKGEVKSVTFKHAGVVDMFCSIHSKMNATIVVAPSPWHARADVSGAFEISGVPAGRYRLRTWNRKLPEASTILAVSEGKITDASPEIRVSK
jgi:plastocyanin